jgi:hypothetical protein
MTISKVQHRRVVGTELVLSRLLLLPCVAYFWTLKLDTTSCYDRLHSLRNVMIHKKKSTLVHLLLARQHPKRVYTHLVHNSTARFA